METDSPTFTVVRYPDDRQLSPENADRRARSHRYGGMAAKKETIIMSAVAAKPATKKRSTPKTKTTPATPAAAAPEATETKIARSEKRELLLVEKETLLLNYLQADPERGFRLGDLTSVFQKENDVSDGLMGALAARRDMPGKKDGSKLTIGKVKGKSKWGHADHVGLDA